MHLSDDAPYRGEILASEYLGTTQIVTVRTAHGQIKARIPSHEVVREGEQTGLTFDARTLSVFDSETGRALTSVANKEVLHHG